MNAHEPPAPEVIAFHDAMTGTFSYIVRDPHGTTCAIVDPVLDYDLHSGAISTASASKIVDYVRHHGWQVQWLLETHAHADHMSAAAWLKSEVGGRIAIGARIADVQARFARLFDLGPDFRTDGSAFDRLFEDGDVFSIGSLGARVIATPGHTPACVTYVVGNAAFVGDTLFRPDYGTARADFPGGDARTLFRSARRILELPPDTRLFTGHDYPSPGRAAMCESSVAAQRRGSAWVGDGVSEDDYVARRRARDRTLALPSLILPALQVNIRAGRLPESSANGIRYLRIPIDQFGATR